MNSHRDAYYDLFIGKRVKIWFKDGDIIKGKFAFNENTGKYALTSCINFKKGMMWHDLVFRKSHIKKMEVISNERL